MKDDAQIIAEAAGIVERAFIGAMATVDEQARPQGRYMAAVAENAELRHLFSLTATETRKVREIRGNANVCWLFTDQAYEQVVKLNGKVSFTDTTSLPMDVWNSLVEYADAYVTSELRDKEHFAFYAMVTRVVSVELLSPTKMGLVTPRVVEIDHS